MGSNGPERGAHALLRGSAREVDGDQDAGCELKVDGVSKTNIQHDGVELQGAFRRLGHREKMVSFLTW